MALERCEYADDHPEIEAKLSLMAERLTRLETAVYNREETRMEDLTRFTDKMGEVHEKVNSVALRMEELKGRVAMFAAFGTFAGGLLMFAIQSLFAHVSQK